MHTSAFIFIALSSRAVLKGVEKVTLQATDTFFLLSVASYDGSARRVCPRVPSLHFDPSRQAIRCGGDTVLATYKLFMTSQPLLLSDVTKILLFRSRLRFSTLPSLPMSISLCFADAN